MDYAKINEAAQNYKDDMTRFLRAIVRNPGESWDEKGPCGYHRRRNEKLDLTKCSSIPREM